MTRVSGTIIRCVSIILLVCLCAGSVLYVDGFFEFTFIDRHGDAPSGTETSATLTDDIISTTLAGTSVGDSITSLFPPDSSGTDSGTDPGTSPPVSGSQGGDSSGSGETTSPTVDRFSPISVLDYIAQGYSITYNNYTSDMVIAEVPLPQVYTSLTTGTALYRKSTLMPLYSDETFNFSGLVSAKKDRFTVESYMGYILISTDKTTVIYDYTGFPVYISDILLSPAYTRDRENRPLFFTSNTDDFYYVDFATKQLVLSDYNDLADGRGLYFNYNPMFGMSDNKYSTYSAVIDYTRTFNIDLASSYMKSNVSHLIAKELYLMYPKYANAVAKYNQRFSAALKIAKQEIAKEEADRATATTLPETTLSPETTVPPDITSAPADVTAPETTVSPEVSTAPDVTVSPDSGTTQSPSEPISSSEETTTEVTTPEETTTSKYPSDAMEGYDTVVKTFTDLRFGFGSSPDKLSVGYSYAKAYNFSEKRAAVVDDWRRLTFLNTSFKTAINGYKKYKYVIPGAGQGIYYIRNYFEPLYSDERGLGHLYFDDGYVMVRAVEVRTVKNKVADKDENVLITTKGTVIAPPEGYNLVTCTEGIMVLERNGRYGYYDPDTQTWIAQPMYTYIEPFYEGLGVIGMEGESIGAIDKNGTVVIPFKFSYVSYMSTGIISAYSTDCGWQVFAKLSK